MTEPIGMHAELREAAEFTRKDLGESGANYPHIRTLLAFAEAALDRASVVMPRRPTPEMKRILGSARQYGTESNGEIFPERLWQDLVESATSR